MILTGLCVVFVHCIVHVVPGAYKPEKERPIQLHTMA